jgi:hypothetical protein
MAIVVSFTPSVVTLNTTGGPSTFTLTDATTGYGTRSNFGVYLTVFKTDFSGLMSSMVSTQNGVPTTSTIWTVNFQADGWHQGLYVAVPLWNSGTTYNQYDAVYDLSSNKVYTSVAGSNLNHSVLLSQYWTSVLDPTVLALNVGLTNASGNLNGTTGAVATINFSQYPLTKQAFGTQTGIAFLEESTDAKRTKDVRKYHLLELAVNGMKNADNALQYQLVEIYARRAQQVINNPAG